jgi:hypothetical protein
MSGKQKRKHNSVARSGARRGAAVASESAAGTPAKAVQVKEEDVEPISARPTAAAVAAVASQPGSSVKSDKRPGNACASMLDGLPSMRVPMDLTVKKACSFMCGAVWGRTPDPVQPDRSSIRWAYEKAAVDSPPTPDGTNDWWCERAWSRHAVTVAGRNRVEFQRTMAKDRDILGVFLRVRDEIVQKAKAMKLNAKRRGGAIFRHTLFFGGWRVRCSRAAIVCDVLADACRFSVCVLHLELCVLMLRIGRGIVRIIVL